VRRDLGDIAANRDIGLEARHYFPCGDIGALTAALAGQHAHLAPSRDAIMARFNWDAIAEQTLEIYESLLDSSGVLAAVERAKAAA
jgi:hypothetical protein